MGSVSRMEMTEQTVIEFENRWIETIQSEQPRE